MRPYFLVHVTEEVPWLAPVGEALSSTSVFLLPCIVFESVRVSFHSKGSAVGAFSSAVFLDSSGKNEALG